MNIAELETTLRDLEIPVNSYSLKGGLPSEAYCIDRIDTRWIYYYSERGRKTGVVWFEKESEACEFLLEKLKKFAAPI